MEAWPRILVHLDASPQAEKRLQMARLLAQGPQAVVTAMPVLQPAWVGVPAVGLGADAAAAAIMAEADLARQRQARQAFDQASAQAGTPMVWLDRPGFDNLRHFIEQSWFHDLTVLSQVHPDDTAYWGVTAGFAPEVAVSSGRPVLMLPRFTPTTARWQRILVAWKSSRESARALLASLPLLQQADQVEVLSWAESRNAITPVPQGLEDWLRVHGVQARVVAQGLATQPVGELLLARCAEGSADLLVMGCYGHTRAHEWLFGGATRHVLAHANVPVLLAH